MIDDEKYFNCSKKECVGCKGGACIILTSRILRKKCPFFKTINDVIKDWKFCAKRLGLNIEDYIKYYIDNTTFKYVSKLSKTKFIEVYMEKLYD